jgi:hypothetical protein
MIKNGKIAAGRAFIDRFLVEFFYDVSSTLDLYRSYD